jgi:hypothetical protein
VKRFPETVTRSPEDLVMRTPVHLVLLLALVAAEVWQEGAAAEPQEGGRLSPDTFLALRQAVRTDYQFRWQALPWEVNPGEAAVKAAVEGKPILTFGGHDGVPLGFE